MSATPLASLALALLASSLATLPAQTASYTTYGQSCGHPSRAPDMFVLAPPQLGQPFTVVYHGLVDALSVRFRTYTYTPLLITGVSSTMSGGLMLPFAIPTSITAGATGCALQASMEVVLTMTRFPPHRNEARVTLSIPNLPSLLGMSFYQQCATLTEVRNRGQLVSRSLLLSNGGHAVIGL